MKGLLMLLACLISLPAIAADKSPAGKTTVVAQAGPFAGGKVMGQQDRDHCWLAIRLAARVQCRKGAITRDQRDAIFAGTDDKECYAMMCEHVQDMVTQQVSAGASGPAASGGWLAWIMANWQSILQMILTIIPLFS